MGLLAEAEDQLPATPRNWWCPAATVRLPLSWDDPVHPRGDRALHARRPRRRAVVPVEHRVHPADERSGVGRTTCFDTVFDARVPGARARRRLPRRAGRHAARPAAPAGHHQVQPGPHLDAGERGRDRRRLPVHLRDGGPGRLPVRRPHHAGVEPPAPASGRDRSRTAPRGCCGSSTGSAGTRSSPTSCWTCGPTRPPGGGRVQITDGTFSLAEHERFLATTPTSIDAPRPPRRGVRAEARGLVRGGRVRRTEAKEAAA